MPNPFTCDLVPSLASRKTTFDKFDFFNWTSEILGSGRINNPLVRARALHPLHPSLPASRLSLPFGLRHRFPSLLPFLSIHRGDFFQHPSVSLESRREERGTGGEGGGEDKKSTWRGNPSARGRGGERGGIPIRPRENG